MTISGSACTAALFLGDDVFIEENRIRAQHIKTKQITQGRDYGNTVTLAHTPSFPRWSLTPWSPWRSIWVRTLLVRLTSRLRSGAAAGCRGTELGRASA